MKQDLPIKSLRDYVNGVIHEDIVDDAKQPDNCVNEAINLHFDTMGAVKSRKGLAILGSQLAAASTVLGMHQFLDEGSGTNDQLVAAAGSNIYYYNAGTDAWVSIDGSLTLGSQTYFTNFLDRIIRVNGNDAPTGWDGNTGGSFDTTNLVSAPTAQYVDNFRSRLWMANSSTYPSRLFYSSAASSTGTITWSGDFIDISPGDGEDITGIKRSPRALLVFKPNHIYRVYDVNDTDPDPSIFVGTYSQKSVVEAKDGYYFHDWTNSAIHRYTGGVPQEISKPIKPYLEGVSLANRSLVAAWKDSDHVYFSIGDITLNGVTFANVVAVRTISSQTWTLYSYPSQLRAGTLYDDGSTLGAVVGDEDGRVYRFNSGNDDNGTPITFSLVTKWYDLSGVRSSTDTINQLAALHRNAEGTSLQYQTDKSTEFNWEPVGQKLGRAPVTVMDTEIEGHRVRFRLSGTSSGEPFIYQGIEILKSFTNSVVE